MTDAPFPKVPGGMRMVPRRHPERLVTAGVALLALALLIQLFVTSPRWEWPVVWEYLFSPPILLGVARTIQLTLVAFVLGLALGLIVALMRMSQDPVLRFVAGIFLWFNRAVPVLVTLLFIFFLAALVPEIGFGIPFTGPIFFAVDTNLLISQFTAAVIGLVLIEGAYKAEIIRGGIMSVHVGQTEAAKSLGMTRGLYMRRIILPQAVRVMVPAMGNQFISLFKSTSIVSVIGYSELLTTVQLIYNRTYQTIPLLVVACIWYLSLASLAMYGQRKLEQRFGRGFDADPVPAKSSWARNSWGWVTNWRRA
ncbi:MAG: amino acid ABC transporter permease [Devosia nanyangense]|nr:amino acid ABC transporter permease [Devosia nanyangense]QMV01769.1 ABC transporter permease subunit [Devosia sp. D6-9]